MYLRIVRDPALLNLFVPEINCKIEQYVSDNDLLDSPIYNLNNSNDIVNNFNNLCNSNYDTTQITSLVVQKQYAILNPLVVYRVKKSIKLSIRSFLISLSLTFLNFFI